MFGNIHEAGRERLKETLMTCIWENTLAWRFELANSSCLTLWAYWLERGSLLKPLQCHVWSWTSGQLSTKRMVGNKSFEANTEPICDTWNFQFFGCWSQNSLSRHSLSLSLSLPLTRYGESLRQMIWWSEQRKLGTRISLKRKKHVWR